MPLILITMHLAISMDIYRRHIIRDTQFQFIVVEIIILSITTGAIIIPIIHVIGIIILNIIIFEIREVVFFPQTTNLLDTVSLSKLKWPCDRFVSLCGKSKINGYFHRYSIRHHKYG